jgi:hypothetical protein
MIVLSMNLGFPNGIAIKPIATMIDLPELDFDASLCRLGLMFLDDLDTGLSNIYKSLVNG